MSNNNSLNQPTNVSSNSLLAKLLTRGDSISIANGLLVIDLLNGQEVPMNWFKSNSPLITNEICLLFNIHAFQYLSYTSGRFGSKKTEGISLQFIHLLTHDDVYTIFNANLKRARSTTHGKKGSPLPNKQFIVTKKYNFYKFWCTTGLKLPPRLSSFHDYMGKLKSLTFTGEIEKNNRIIKTSIRPLNISFQQITSKLHTIGSITKVVSKPDKFHAINQQAPNNGRTSIPDKDSKLAFDINALDLHSSTCTSKCGNTVIRKEVLSTGVGLDNTPINNTNNKEVDENINEVNLQKKRPEEQTVDEWLEDWEAAFTAEEFDEVMTDFSK